MYFRKVQNQTERQVGPVVLEAPSQIPQHHAENCVIKLDAASVSTIITNLQKPGQQHGGFLMQHSGERISQSKSDTTNLANSTKPGQASALKYYILSPDTSFLCFLLPQNEMLHIENDLGTTQPPLFLFQASRHLIISRPHHRVLPLQLSQVQLITSQAIQADIDTPTDPLGARNQQKDAQNLPLEPQGGHQGEPRLVSPPVQNLPPRANKLTL